MGSSPPGDVFQIRFSKYFYLSFMLGTVHLKSGRGAGRFKGRVIKFQIFFIGGGVFKIYNTCFGRL